MAKCNIIILPDGQMRFMVIEGDFAGGSTALNKLVNGLGAQGATFKSIGQPEQHRHDDGGEGQREVHTH